MKINGSSSLKRNPGLTTEQIIEMTKQDIKEIYGYDVIPRIDYVSIDTDMLVPDKNIIYKISWCIDV